MEKSKGILKLYTSSIGFWNRFPEFLDGLPKNPRMAYVVNAKDHEDPAVWRERNDKKIAEFENMGFRAEILDLKKYFWKTDELTEKLWTYDFVWVRWWNVFVLARAVKLSGFKEALLRNLKFGKSLAYWWWSAGACILSKSLSWAEFVDNPLENPYWDGITVNIYEGMGIIDQSVVPHFGSSEVVEYVKFLTDNSMPYIPLQDGEDAIFEVTISEGRNFSKTR